ncbi:MAG TPA: glycosyltransferase [Burkholderiales bacterium]|nr:glycosyltransferase [Burkholderiales bacterium]
MRPLKIAHTESSLGWGGQEHRTLKEMRALRARGHALELICPPAARLGDRAEEEGFHVHRVRMRGGADVPAMLAIRRILRRGRFDVVNSHSGHDSLLAGIAGRTARTPLVVRTRHLALAITSVATYKWLPHKVVAVSEYVRQYLISAGVPAAMTATVHTGIEPLPEVAASTLRSELGLPDTAIVIGTVAILRIDKGHQGLIDAARPVLAARPDVHLVFAGDGPLYDKLKRSITDSGLANRVHLLGLRNDVANVLAGFDLFALATRREALGTAYIEAMAAGLPVIGTAVGGVPEVIENNVNGLLAPAQDRDALTAALFTMVDDPALRARMGEAGRALTATRFSVETMAAEMEALYRQGPMQRGMQ